MATQNQTQQKTRKLYVHPKLVKYGDVRELTQAGSGLSTEQKPGQGTKTKKP